MSKYLPIILGICLGIVSIIMGQVPRAVAQFSGMTAIGNHMGYLWLALIVAWLCSQSWRKSFAMSFLAILAANLIYYPVLTIFHLFDIALAPPPWHLWRSFVYWTAIAAIISVLAATAVWLALKAKFKLLNYGIFLVSFLGMVLVMIYENRMFIISRGGITLFQHNYAQAWQVAGHYYQLGFSLVVTVIILGVGLNAVVKKKNRRVG